MAYICVRCKNKRIDFDVINNKRLKTCNRCRIEKKRYAQTDKGKNVYAVGSKKWNQTKSGKLSASNTHKRMLQKYPEKNRARGLLYLAIKRGKMIKGKCFCNNLKVEAHHQDYNKPLEVIWLCKKHHTNLHMKGVNYSI